MSFPGMFKPGDLIILLVISFIALIWASSGPDRGAEPVGLRIVDALGEDTVSLFSDTLIHRGPVTIEILDGKGAITGSDCPTGRCVDTGWIGEPGGFSACMPNGVLIEIIGGGVATDAVTY